MSDEELEIVKRPIPRSRDAEALAALDAFMRVDLTRKCEIYISNGLGFEVFLCETRKGGTPFSSRLKYGGCSSSLADAILAALEKARS